MHKTGVCFPEKEPAALKKAGRREPSPPSPDMTALWREQAHHWGGERADGELGLDCMSRELGAAAGMHQHLSFPISPSCCIHLMEISMAMEEWKRKALGTPVVKEKEKADSGQCHRDRTGKKEGSLPAKKHHYKRIWEEEGEDAPLTGAENFRKEGEKLLLPP